MQKCPLFNITDVLGKRWTIVLLQEIEANGNKGFNFLFKRMQKISPKILAKRLKSLEEQGLIAKSIVENNNSISTRYSLTEKGRAVSEIIISMKKFNSKYSGLEGCERRDCVNCSLY